MAKFPVPKDEQYILSAIFNKILVSYKLLKNESLNIK